MTKIDKIDWSVLSGPYVSRRTMMKVALASGAIPFASWLAACGGDDDDDDATATTEEGGGAQETVTEAEGDAESTAEDMEATDEEVDATEDAGVSLTAAAETPTAVEGATAGGSIKVGYNISQITNLDPGLVNQGVVAGELISNLFSSLVQFDENLGIVPDLAETWTVSEDGTEYVFTLREGLTFHNGESLTANDFVYTYERNIDPDFASPHANKLESITSIEATDDTTLTLVMSEPFGPFLAVACSRGPGRALTPINQTAFEEMGGEAFTFAPVGCGPFMIDADSRVVGEGFKLLKFEDWYGEGPLLDEIEIVIISEPSSMVAALEAGDIDMLLRPPNSVMEQVLSNGDLTTVELPGTNWEGLTMNYNNPPWDNPDARMAVAKAFDNQDYIDRAFLGIGLPAIGAIAPAFKWAYVDPADFDDAQAYDLEGAQALAESAGLDGVSVNFLQTAGAGERSAEVIRNMMSDIGLDVQIEVLQSAARNERWLAGEYDWTLSGSVVDADPDDGHWNFFFSEGPWNTFGYADEEIDNMLLATRASNDSEERAQLFQDIQAKTNADIVAVFTVHLPDFVSFYPYVQGNRPIPEIRYWETLWRDDS